jgi:hypothetical protein
MLLDTPEGFLPAHIIPACTGRFVTEKKIVKVE